MQFQKYQPIIYSFAKHKSIFIFRFVKCKCCKLILFSYGIHVGSDQRYASKHVAWMLHFSFNHQVHLWPRWKCRPLYKNAKFQKKIYKYFVILCTRYWKLHVLSHSSCVFNVYKLSISYFWSDEDILEVQFDFVINPHLECVYLYHFLKTW